MIDEIDNALKFTITKEGKHQLDKVLNYDEVKAQIVGDLERLRDEPLREECPSIYHLDVGAMYPNIILTNRLQPDAIVDETVCASCDFNEGPDSACQRKMPWSWRGEYFMANKGDYNMIRNQLEQEKFPGRKPELPMRAFHELPHSEQEALVKKRMGEYTQKIYGKKFGTKVVEKESIVCQRENPFYVNTVRDFRDRRYEYKALLKQWKKKLEQATKIDDASAIYEGKSFCPSPFNHYSVQNDSHLRLFADCSQVYFEFLLWLCHAKSCSLVLYGDGRHCLLDWSENYSIGTSKS